jgi:AAA15 family ATPase/GTPase
MINKLSLKKFTVFHDFEIEFAKGVNVIVGENGTGKSHLLKAGYALCSGNNRIVERGKSENGELADDITNKILGLFLPLDEKLGKLRSSGSGSEGASEMAATFGPKPCDVRVTFNNNSSKVVVQGSCDQYEQYAWKPSFIPTKEVLSFMKGFNSLYERFQLSFDQTYRDLILSLELPELRSDRLHEKSKWAMEGIEEICKGKFVFHGSGKVTFVSETGEYSANVMAEGFRKIGIVKRLLETGSIEPGVSGPLFWDEPESNLNPTLSKFLVEVLLELARNGQQVILATHDYVLLKWLDLLSDDAHEDHVGYHALFRTEDGHIDVETTQNYLAVDPNAIADTFGKIYDAEVQRSFGGTK